jgi:hypothetical protein
MMPATAQPAMGVAVAVGWLVAIAVGLEESAGVAVDDAFGVAEADPRGVAVSPAVGVAVVSDVAVADDDGVVDGVGDDEAEGVRVGVAVRVGVGAVDVGPGRVIVTVCCATLFVSESSVMRSNGSIVTRSVYVPDGTPVMSRYWQPRFAP